MINLDARGAVSVVEIDRHERRNALDVAHCRMLGEAVTAAVSDGARAVVLTGAGSAFCAGADLDQVTSTDFRDALYEVIHAVVRVPVPVVAAVNGPAIGAGTQLAIACDLRVAAPSAIFAVPTAKLGLAVDTWTLRRLGLLAGGGVARVMLLACETLGPEAALACGLVDRLGEPAQAVEWAEAVAGLAPLTLAFYKQALGSLFEPEGAHQDLTEAFEACWASQDAAEGARAREEQRPPRFSGR